MTVVLALRCAEGLVLATDSQATAAMPGGTPVRMDAPKIVKLGNSMLFAGTGAQGVGQRVKAELDRHASKLGKNKARAQIGAAIHSIVNPIQQASFNSWVRVPQTEPEAWAGIFCGWSTDGPFIAECDLNGGWQFHDNPPFASSGSGHAFAHLAVSSVLHFDVAGQDLERAKAIAYRAIENVCLASALGVGLPVQLGVVLEGGVNQLDDAELDDVKDLVNLWKTKEVETLGALAPGGAAGAQAEGAPGGEPAGLDEPEADAPEQTA